LAIGRLVTLRKAAEAVTRLRRARAEEVGDDSEVQVTRVFALALQRAPDVRECEVCAGFQAQHSLVAFCRSALNLNEFSISIE